MYDAKYDRDSYNLLYEQRDNVIVYVVARR